ncbi:MAG: AMP-binding protein [Microbacteriaceae bacterium]
MTRDVRVVSGVAETWSALRDALTADGPAILPRVVGWSGDNHGEPTPRTVDRRVCLVVETSGTSGAPKRVALSADALLASAAASASALGGQGQWLLALPTHYIAGINVLVRSISAGTDPVGVSGGSFSVDGFARATDRLESPVVFTSLVPAQLVRLLGDEQGIRALRRFERVLVGGQATPVGVLEVAASHGIRVTRTYGSSETSGGCVYDGKPIGQTVLRISDGHIEISGPTLAEGYLADPARTDANFLVENGTRWYRTGDSGDVSNGVLSVTGRLDDVIISGGIKISLGALERVVRSLPHLSSSVVFGEHSDVWGHVPVVVTEHPADSGETLAIIRAAVAQQLGREAQPVRVEFVEHIPLVASGKPDMQRIRRAWGRTGVAGQ